jgi:hypothetical protein
MTTFHSVIAFNKYAKMRLRGAGKDGDLKLDAGYLALLNPAFSMVTRGGIQQDKTQIGEKAVSV